jgi:glycine betaine catabolism B
MAAVRKICAELGVPAANYMEESFDAALTQEAPTYLAREEEDNIFKVEFLKQGRKIDVSSDQTVLWRAKKLGVRIPSWCANGLCGTCKSKLASGSVDMKHNGGIRQREIDAGYFLPCCSKPLGDLVIER